MATTNSKAARFNDSMVELLPCEIFFNIFLRLPVKSILRCQYVCKSWGQFVCDPYFVRMHLSLNQSQKLLLQSSPHHSFYSVDCEETHDVAVQEKKIPLKSPNSIRILCSCNGLVCVGVIRDQIFPVELILWNPTTGKYKTLPDVQLSDHDRIQTVGFGYELSTDDYKLVRIAACNRLLTITSCKYRVDLYSLKTNSWKKIREVPDHNVVRFDHHSGKWAPNGSIYWGACRQSKIIAFDLMKEEFRELVLPDEIRQVESRKHVIVLGGCIGVYYWPRTPKHEILVWTMKEDDEKKENWSMLMTGSEYRWSPICSLDNMKLLLCKQELNSLITFAVYDPKGIRKYPIRIRGVTGCRGLWVNYTESLVSLNSE